MQATHFSLPDQNSVNHDLTSYKGKWVVLYFYPKDDTPGCTKEACDFRDSYTDLEQHGVKLLGVSMDTVSSHKKFADKFHLPFPLLSDESGETVKAYNAWQEPRIPGFSAVQRKTFLISPEGEIIKTYDKVNPFTHAKEIFTDLAQEGIK